MQMAYNPPIRLKHKRVAKETPVAGRPRGHLASFTLNTQIGHTNTAIEWILYITQFQPKIAHTPKSPVLSLSRSRTRSRSLTLSKIARLK